MRKVKELVMKRLIVIAAIFLIFTGNFAFAGDPKGTADVPARDLNIWGLGWAGHVGMWTGSRVLEVMNASPVVRQTYLSSFKKASKYWGAKYGKAGTKGLNIINAGWNQRNYSPSYTTTATWQEGKWVQKRVWDSAKRAYVYKNVMQTAKFRCDTFVYYSYLKGAGVRLTGLTITPKAVYNSLPYTR